MFKCNHIGNEVVMVATESQMILHIAGPILKQGGKNLRTAESVRIFNEGIHESRSSSTLKNHQTNDFFIFLMNNY